MPRLTSYSVIPACMVTLAAGVALSACNHPAPGGDSAGNIIVADGSPNPVPPDAPPSPTAPATPPPTAIGRPIPSPIWGVTLDDVAPLSDEVAALKSLAKTPTARIVFDQGVQSSYYVTPVNQLRQVSYIMGEILDSQYVSSVSVSGYADRTSAYLSQLGGNVDLWEIGNEINGEWLGDTATVVSKMTGAYDLVKAAGGRTALTLYYNQGCWSQPDHEMFAWTQANVPDRMKSGLDYVLVSYYEHDCNDLKPDWNAVFQKLAATFPNSKVGFGETGTAVASEKASYLTRYYVMTGSPPVPSFIGGYFWWYAAEDVVPMSKPLWSTLDSVISAY